MTVTRFELPIPFPRSSQCDAQCDGVSTVAGPMVDVTAIHTAAGGRVQYRQGGLAHFTVDAAGALALIRETAVAVHAAGDPREARIGALVVALLDQLDPLEEVTPLPPTAC